MKPKAPLILFILLCTSFLVYSFSIYLGPGASVNFSDEELDQASRGKLVWQKYNCQSCHQIFNLGGYLGPDLTNCMSQPGKGEPYVKAMIMSGTTQMPAFKLTEEEMKDLIGFLGSIDKTGTSDLRKFKTLPNGMIESYVEE